MDAILETRGGVSLAERADLVAATHHQIPTFLSRSVP